MHGVRFSRRAEPMVPIEQLPRGFMAWRISIARQDESARRWRSCCK